MPNRTKDDGYILALSRPDGDGDHPWGQPVEVPLKKMRVCVPRGFWSTLAQELKLRLECTRADRAIAVPFPNPDHLRKARDAVYRWFHTTCGPNAVHISAERKPDGSGVLYISRGPNWK
jgi:hypothetical protein